MKFKTHFIALASAALLSTGIAQAADGHTKTMPATKTTEQSVAPAKSTSAMKAMNAEREQLAQKLRAGKTRADLDKILQDNGFRISAINEDKKDYLEYEVVKGQNSYEVQMDFSDGPSHATKIQVEPNMWSATPSSALVTTTPNTALTTKAVQCWWPTTNKATTSPKAWTTPVTIT